MSYSIEYNPELRKQYPSVTKRIKKVSVKKLGFLVITLAIIYGLHQSGITQYFIPGDPEITVAAFSELVEQIGDGKAVGEAVLRFCEEIITYAS